MEHQHELDSKLSRKRKLRDERDPLSLNTSSFKDLNEDILERVLSRLPTSSFFRFTTVCKRWKSVAASTSFKLACSQIPSRDPWFLMVSPNLHQSIVFDSAESSWKRLNYPPCLQKYSTQDCIPVAASGGLICYHTFQGNLIVCNPLTGSCIELPQLQFDQPLHAIVMSTSPESRLSFRIVLVIGEFPKLSFVVYDSSTGSWDQDVSLRRKADDSMEFDSPEGNVLYFLSKSGNVLATNMQRSPSKQYSSVITNKNSEEVIYFLSSSGSVVSCNLTSKCFLMLPRLLPVFCEYSIDVVECSDDMLVVLLSEFLETASLRVWKYDEDNRCWNQIAVMPPAMSHQWYGKKVDINCSGAGDQLLVCLNSTALCTYILCHLETNTWTELSKCCINGKASEFMSAISFEPRIEASVGE